MGSLSGCIFCLQSAGDECVKFLQYVCSNDVDKPIGTIVHTGMQNHHGGFENDCSVIRMDDNKYVYYGTAHLLLEK